MRSASFALLHRCQRVRGLASVVLVFAFAFAGCTSPAAGELDAAAGDEPCASGSCARATEGCPVDGIEQRADAVCAVCAGAGGDVEICGDPTVARCEAREDAEGRPCRFCATASGELLYDSCYTDVKPEAVACESVPNAAAGDGGAEDAAREQEPDDDIVCQACTDEAGRVVSTICEPAHDACRIVEDEGRACRECTRDGAVVIFTCEEPRLEPRSCEVYADVDGRCVDCYDDDDQLLLHSCTLAVQDVGCSEIVTAEGLTCDVCMDATGAIVSNSCRSGPRTLERCTFLDFTDQSCLVCLDDQDAIGLTRCEPTACAGPGCPPPPPCAWERSPDGPWCRTCPVEGSRTTEERCVEETRLACTAEQAPAGDGDGVCVACSDTISGVEAYRRCDGGAAGSPAPPACYLVEAGEGAADAEVCELCTDPQSGRTVYATCEDQSCFDAGVFQLADGAGAPLFVDGQAAVATCASCVAAAPDADDGASSASATCALRSECGPIDLTAPDAPCDGAVVFTLEPLVCGNPWLEPAGPEPAPPGDVREALVVLRHALATANVALLSVTSRPPEGAATCSEGCACPRGDTLAITARAEDAFAVQTLYGALIAPCDDDGDCDGGVCRLDGACGF